MVRRPGDFGGQCLIGECTFDPELMLPTTSYLGLRKGASYLYGSLRDGEGNLLRVLRGIEADKSALRLLFVAEPGGQLQQHRRTDEMWCGPTSIACSADIVTFASEGAGAPECFQYVHTSDTCTWNEADVMELAGEPLGPAVQWLNTWESGACFSATAKYRVRGHCIGRSVEGFVGHEIHYFPAEVNWLTAPYGRGREICWQQIANEYDDGSIIQATFACGTEGWGFAMVHDEAGAFTATTDLRAEATVGANGYPRTIRYVFGDQAWTWRIDPQGERPSIAAIPMLGADGTCARDGDHRTVRHSMGNSDWWTDGRAAHIIRS